MARGVSQQRPAGVSGAADARVRGSPSARGIARTFAPEGGAAGSCRETRSAPEGLPRRLAGTFARPLHARDRETFEEAEYDEDADPKQDDRI